MTTYPIPQDIYNGCGAVWAAIKDGRIVGLRYMADYPYPTLESLGRKRLTDSAMRDLAAARSEAFSAHRAIARAELALLGEVRGGMASCYEFIPSRSAGSSAPQEVR